MKAIILAAGYATRLFPLTKNFPKPLIKINNKPMINYVLGKAEEIGVKEVFVVTNEKFGGQFEEWAKSYNGQAKVSIINDHTLSNEDRLGAIGDIQYTIEQANIDDDILVIASDNLFKFSLYNALNLFRKTNKSTIIAYDVKEKEEASKMGVVSIDETKKVTSFVEKPESPATTLCAIAVYFYPKNILPLIKRYLDEGHNKDAPGNLPAWLIKEDEVYCQVHEEKWYDIGGFEKLKQAKEDFGEENVDIEQLQKEKN